MAAPETNETTGLGKFERELARRNLLDFQRVMGTRQGPYVDNDFGSMLAGVCQQFIEDCVAKKKPRVMCFAPPQHGKSETVSRHTPAWALGRYPHLRFVGASYGDVLAKSMSRDVMSIIEQDEYREVFPGTRIPSKGAKEAKRSDDYWEIIGHPGSYRARGVGQGLSGFGADPLMIDDPFKDRRDARSPAIRRDVWDWYSAVGRLRVQPGSGVFLMHTRWHVGDLAGLLLEQMATGEGEEWQVVKFPAIATKDEEFSKEGDALCPHRFPLDELRAVRSVVGPYVWASLYQQSPSVEGGGVFEAEWWQYYDPNNFKVRILYRAIFADTAMKTKDTNDYSVFQCWGFGADGRIYLLDQIRGKWKAPELLRRASAFWDKWSFSGKDLEQTKSMYIEDKVSGTGLIQTLQARTYDAEGKKGAIPVKAVQRNIDKAIRADSAAPHIEAGNVVLPQSAPYLSDFLQEFADFTMDNQHAFDDQVDPTMDAIDIMLRSSRNIYSGAIS
jgi:predicted phage terminase large subunit-like protein